MNEHDALAALTEARRELAEAAKAVPVGFHADGRDQWEEIQRRCLDLERDLARARGEPCAVVIACPAWDVGAPLPAIISTGSRTVLFYRTPNRDPNWDGTYVTMVSESDASDWVRIDFKICRSHRFGCPNDEVLSGHPLYGRGLEYYRAHIVERSPWIDELRKINSVHSCYDPKTWTNYHHYLFAFHDDMFECVALSFTTRLVHGGLSEIVRTYANDIE